MTAAAPQAGALRVTFLGTSTLLLDDGTTAVLVDGFFSRPSKWQLLGKVAPDRPRIAATLQRLGVSRLAAVVVNHTHYDHALDAPEVAMRTGALLVGSESTANVGRGWDLPEAQIRVVSPSDAASRTMAFGAFELTFVPSRHVVHALTHGQPHAITAPLRPPAAALDYHEGGVFSILVRHGSQTLSVQGSAGFVEGALRGQRADVIFLGIGVLGKQDAAYRDAYWRETVQALGARRVVPIHWDDFTLPLDAPLEAMPPLMDDFDVALGFVVARGQQEGIDVKLAPTWVSIDPFAGLGS